MLQALGVVVERDARDADLPDHLGHRAVGRVGGVGGQGGGVRELRGEAEVVAGLEPVLGGRHLERAHAVDDARAGPQAVDDDGEVLLDADVEVTVPAGQTGLPFPAALASDTFLIASAMVLR